MFERTRCSLAVFLPSGSLGPGKPRERDFHVIVDVGSARFSEPPDMWQETPTGNTRQLRAAHWRAGNNCDPTSAGPHLLALIMCVSVCVCVCVGVGGWLYMCREGDRGCGTPPSWAEGSCHVLEAWPIFHVPSPGHSRQDEKLSAGVQAQLPRC